MSSLGHHSKKFEALHEASSLLFGRYWDLSGRLQQKGEKTKQEVWESAYNLLRKGIESK